MNTYLFLTNTIGGYSGGAAYIRNKVCWLKDNGWEVNVFDATGQLYEKIRFDVLKPFKNNRIPELYYNPNDLSSQRRERVINRICGCVKASEKIVVESNLFNLSIWGELIAEKLKAKHIIYLIAENLVVLNESLYSFLKYKSNNSELFSINAKAYRLLFSSFENVEDEDDHWWTACNASPIVDIKNKKIDTIPPANITISHFGRYKDYFPYMLREINDFARTHQDKKINFLLLGLHNVKINQFIKCNKNLNIVQLGSMNTIPKSFYEKSDVVIAAAGCASMSFRYGAVVISMDVANDTPLGVLGYTTLDRTYRSSDNKNNDSLSSILEEILIKQTYKEIIREQLKTSNKGYEYQLTFASYPPSPYYYAKDVQTEWDKYGVKGIIMKTLLKMGFVSLKTFIRHLSFQLRHTV